MGGDVEKVARSLTKAQRAVLLESEPGGFGRIDEACGASLVGAGEVSAARALSRKRLGDLEDHWPFYPRFLYFNNQTGLAVRAYLTGAP